MGSSRSLKTISRKHLSSKDKVHATFVTVSGDDRNAVLTSTALLEYGIERAIRSRLRKLKPSDVKDLFEGTAPLASFSAKIRIAYALGVIGPQTRHDLQTINEIRNVFAHSAHNVSFSSKRLRQRIKGMHMVERLADYKYPAGREQFFAALRNFQLLLAIIEYPKYGKVAPAVGELAL